MIHRKIPNIHTATAGKRTLPQGRYYGFAIGPDAHHGELLVELAGVTYFVELGAPVVLKFEGIEGQPIVTPVRYLAHAVTDLGGVATHRLNAWESKAHLMAFECRSELQIAVCDKLRSIKETFTADDGDGGGTSVLAYTMPLYGRSRALISIEGDVGQVGITGASVEPDALVDLTDLETLPTEDEIVATTAHTAGQFVRVVEDLDIYDLLVVRLGDGSQVNGEFKVRCI